MSSNIVKWLDTRTTTFKSKEYGVGTKVVYKIWIEKYSLRLGIIVTAFGTTARINIKAIDKDFNVLKKDLPMFYEYVEYFDYTKQLCLRDFRKRFPEIKKFVINE